MEDIKSLIERGEAVFGMELGSTRIKAVLIDEAHNPIASGSHTWENRLEDGVWTYHMQDVIEGVQDAYADLTRNVRVKYGVELRKVKAMGVSAMMHGYLVFDKDGELLTPFRTWRNTMTGQAAEELSELLQFNVPQRWSISHLYQAILNGEEHVAKIAMQTTLAGYLHYVLTGVHAIGIGEASGMFPIDSTINDYDAAMMAKFDALIAPKGFGWTLSDILPKVLNAGEDAGYLTEEGARFLDPTGTLQAGCPLAPAEGDAGTGMVATNSVAMGTGNVSAGTSVFAMAVLEKAMSTYYPEIDMVTTPTGKPVAMVHCNNCTSDINAWAGIFQGFGAKLGQRIDMGDIFTALFTAAADGDADCGGVLSYNYLSGESVTGLDEGRPMFVRKPDANFTFANFSRSLLYSALSTLKIGMDILLQKEHVSLKLMMGHGGFFKTPVVGQSILAAALNTPVAVMETAGEGGPWGMALLAAYRVNKKDGEALEDYLSERVFADSKQSVVEPEAAQVAGFDAYVKTFVNALPAEKEAVKGM